VTDEVLAPNDHPSTPNELAIVQIVLGQMTLLEQRLMQKMDENAGAARDRWRSHDEQHDEWEKALKSIGHRLDDHLRKEEQEDLIFDARLGPMKRAGAWLTREWRTAAIIFLLLADFATQVIDRLRSIFPQ